MEIEPQYCPCGKPLHYTDMGTKRRVETLIRMSGTHIHIVVDGITYNVQRHYLALHGLDAKDLKKLDFEVIPNERYS